MTEDERAHLYAERLETIRRAMRGALHQGWIRELNVSDVRDVVEEELAAAFDGDYRRAR